jgi:hypothetical protein
MALPFQPSVHTHIHTQIHANVRLKCGTKPSVKYLSKDSLRLGLGLFHFF